MSAKIPLWLDCDPGHDDAFAILLAVHHPALDLIGISTVYGNAPLEKTTNNALSILESIGMSHIPVHPGASKPFCRQVVHADDIHGETGLDGSDLLPQPTRSPLKHCNAICDMRDALMSCAPDTAWLVVTGTTTNAALLFATFPEVAAHIKGLSIMGGAIGNEFTSVWTGPEFTNQFGQVQKRIGNKSPYAEFNIWCDPESAQSLFANTILANKTTLITLDLTHQALVSKDIQNLFLDASDSGGSPTRMRRMFHELLTFFSSTYMETFGITRGPPLHDPLAVAVLLENVHDARLLVDFDDKGGERWNVNVVLEGEEVGRTRIAPLQDSDGITIPRSLNLQQFWNTIQMCLDMADVATGFVR